MKREEIERRWIGRRKSESGQPLCYFFETKDKELSMIWDRIWNTQIRMFISSYFWLEPNSEELSYLCRALSLNMLLDDNEELLK